MAVALSRPGSARLNSGSCRHIEWGDRDLYDGPTAAKYALIYAQTHKRLTGCICEDIAANFLKFRPSDWRAETGARRVHTLDRLPTVTNTAIKRSLQ
jgi:hypothetical protein